MRLRIWLSISALTCITCTAFAHKIPDSAWQKGILKDTQDEQNTRVVGTLNEGSGSIYGGTYTVRHLLIETPEMIYEAVPINGMTRIGLTKGRFDFTVNSTYLFAIEKSEMYIRDANGKEGKFRIVKKTLKKPASASETPH